MYCGDGYNVELGNIAFITPKLKTRQIIEKNEIRLRSICLDNVNFKTSAWFRDQLKGTLVKVEKRISEVNNHGYSFPA